MSMLLDTNVFTGKAPDGLTASDGTTDGFSEQLSGISVTNDRVVISALIPAGAQVQMHFARASSTNWQPLGAPATETDQIPLKLHSSYKYVFEITGATGTTELYVARAPDSLVFENEARIGLGS